METKTFTVTDMQDNVNKDVKPSVFRLLQCKCPRCRRGDMFEYKNPWQLKHTMKMHKECPVCKQPFNLEVGFYYGASYVSYALTIAFSVATFIAWWVIIGISIDDNRVFYWLGFNSLFLLLLQPYFMRVARTGWLAFFIGYDKQWSTKAPKQPERTNEQQEGNW